MTQPQYRNLLSFARKLLDNHPDLTLEPGDLVAEAYLRHGDDAGKMREFMVGYARQTRTHPRRWLGCIPNPKKYPIETTQTCKRCQRELPFDDFNKDDRGALTFYQQTCRRCQSQSTHDRYAEEINKAVIGQVVRVFDAPPDRRTCRVCHIDKPINQFPKQYKGLQIIFRRICKTCYNLQTKTSMQRLAERRRNQPPPTHQ